MVVLKIQKKSCVYFPEKQPENKHLSSIMTKQSPTPALRILATTLSLLCIASYLFKHVVEAKLKLCRWSYTNKYLLPSLIAFIWATL